MYFIQSLTSISELGFSTNYEFEEVWTVMDEIMDTQSEAINNPNSEMDVKLWIKYAYYKRPDYNEEEY